MRFFDKIFSDFVVSNRLKDFFACISDYSKNGKKNKTKKVRKIINNFFGKKSAAYFRRVKIAQKWAKRDEKYY